MRCRSEPPRCDERAEGVVDVEHVAGIGARRARPEHGSGRAWTSVPGCGRSVPVRREPGSIVRCPRCRPVDHGALARDELEVEHVEVRGAVLVLAAFGPRATCGWSAAERSDLERCRRRASPSTGSRDLAWPADRARGHSRANEARRQRRATMAASASARMTHPRRPRPPGEHVSVTLGRRQASLDAVPAASRSAADESRS